MQGGIGRQNENDPVRVVRGHIVQDFFLPFEVPFGVLDEEFVSSLLHRPLDRPSQQRKERVEEIRHHQRGRAEVT